VFWSHLKVENAGSVDTDTTGDRLGAAYTFPMGLKVGLIYDKGKIALNAAGTNADRNAWVLPISYRTGAHNFSFTYAKANDVKGNSAISLANTNAKMTVLGYEYSLSKRTSVSASYSQINNDSAAMYDFWHPSSSVGGGLAAAAVAAGADPRKLHFGVVHKF
jgi:predicted porin